MLLAEQVLHGLVYHKSFLLSQSHCTFLILRMKWRILEMSFFSALYTLCEQINKYTWTIMFWRLCYIFARLSFGDLVNSTLIMNSLHILLKKKNSLILTFRNSCFSIHASWFWLSHTLPFIFWVICISSGVEVFVCFCIGNFSFTLWFCIHAFGVTLPKINFGQFGWYGLLWWFVCCGSIS